MFPPRKRQTARKLAAEVTELFGSYISGQVIVSALTGAVIAIATAVIGFKFSLILASSRPLPMPFRSSAC